MAAEQLGSPVHDFQATPRLSNLRVTSVAVQVVPTTVKLILGLQVCCGGGHLPAACSGLFCCSTPKKLAGKEILQTSSRHPTLNHLSHTLGHIHKALRPAEASAQVKCMDALSRVSSLIVCREAARRMATLQLQARPADVQALKACIAASTAGTTVELDISSGTAAPASLFGTPAICLSTPEGVQLTEPNAAALYAGGMLILRSDLTRRCTASHCCP